MGIFHSPSANAFFDEAVHGPRRIEVEPTEAERQEGQTEPRVIDNPDCRIPADALPIAAEERARLLAAQAGGKVIQVVDGVVTAVDRAVPTGEAAMAMVRRKRDDILAATDLMVALPDYPIAPAKRAELLAYRADLRALPEDLDPALPDGPDAVVWPRMPDLVAPVMPAPEEIVL